MAIFLCAVIKLICSLSLSLSLPELHMMDRPKKQCANLYLFIVFLYDNLSLYLHSLPPPPLSLSLSLSLFLSFFLSLFLSSPVSPPHKHRSQPQSCKILIMFLANHLRPPLQPEAVYNLHQKMGIEGRLRDNTDRLDLVRTLFHPTNHLHKQASVCVSLSLLSHEV